MAASLAELLDMSGHGATNFGSADKALPTLDAVCTGLWMPGKDGAELAVAVRGRHPVLAGRVVLMTGDTLAGPAHAAQVGLKDPIILEEPTTLAEVQATLRRLTAPFPAQPEAFRQPVTCQDGRGCRPPRRIR